MSLAELSSRTFAYPTPKRWTGAEYDRLVEMGVFAHQRLELIEGEIFDMSPMNDPHAYAIRAVQYALLRCFPESRYTVQIQSPMRLGETSRPEPDVALLQGEWRQHVLHPSSALLIVEVADTTLVYDRERKSPLYAMHNIADYWILNLSEKTVEVYREPNGNKYAPPLIFARGQTLSPLANLSCMIAVNDLMP